MLHRSNRSGDADAPIESEADLKILVTSFTFPPQANGVAEIAKAQAFGLASRGHSVTVATDFDPARKGERWPANVSVREFKIQGADNVRGGCHGETALFQQFLAESSADIILCNCWQNWATDLTVRAFPRTRARKVIVSQGFDAHLWHKYPRFAWGLGQWLRAQPYVRRLPSMLRAFDQLIFLSPQRDRQRFYDHWLADRLALAHCSILPNGVWLGELAAAQPDFRQRHDIQTQHMVLNVATYCERKNQHAALRSFLRLGRKDVTLVFIGGEFNAYSEQLLEMGRQHLGTEFERQVRVLAQVPRPTICSAYRSTDVFVLPSTAETQPLVLLEAMGVGVPFVSTPVGCVKELPGGVVVRDEAEMADAINRLLNEPDRRRQLGEEGRAAVNAHYSWESILEQYESLFARLIGAPAREH